jgi:hypothetical protein
MPCTPLFQVKPINFYEKQNLFASLADSNHSSQGDVAKEIMITVPTMNSLKLIPPQTKKLVVYSSQGKTRDVAIETRL